MSPELETLEQLMDGDLPVLAVRHLFPSDAVTVAALTAMLAAGEVKLVPHDYECDDQLPEWQWASALANMGTSSPYDLRITQAGRDRLASSSKTT